MSRNPYRPNPEHVHRACQADRRIARLIGEAEVLAGLVRPSDTACYACLWERLFKARVSEVVGHGRGEQRQARDLDALRDPDAAPSQIIRASDLVPPPRTPVENDTERWLRTSEAYDAVSDAVLAVLWQADPGNGHGVARQGKRDLGPWRVDGAA